jgi:hypothetical protein
VTAADLAFCVSDINRLSCRIFGELDFSDASTSERTKIRGQLRRGTQHV